ncbi:MAG: ABC transporter permease [Acidobacteriota bacterium]
MRALARLALRHLGSRPRQTWLTVAGVALGVAVFVFTVSMMDGLVVYFTRRLIRVSPLLTVLPERLDVTDARAALRAGGAGDVLALTRPPVPDERRTIRGAPGLAGRLREIQGIEGVGLAALTPAIASFGVVAEPATVNGVEVGEEPSITSLPGALTAGSWSGLARRRDGAVVGILLAERLGAEVGDRLVVTGEIGRQRDLEVVGIIASGLGSIDESQVLVHLEVAQGLAGWGSDEASEIRVRTGTLEGLAGLRRRLQDLTGHRVETWEEQSAASLQLFRTIGTTTYLLTGFVLIVAAFGVANRLTTVILDKERDIAILRACGFSKGSVRAVFVVEGVVLGGAGAALGCAAAAGVIALLTAFPIRFPARGGGQVMAYTELYLANDPRYYAVIAGAALAISALAALAAVRRAVRVVPVEVLRGTA